jgi:transcriptional regulator of NAD metabolism
VMSKAPYLKSSEIHKTIKHQGERAEDASLVLSVLYCGYTLRNIVHIYYVTGHVMKEYKCDHTDSWS